MTNPTLGTMEQSEVTETLSRVGLSSIDDLSAEDRVVKFFYTLKRTPAAYKVGYKMRLLPRGGTLRQVVDTVPHGWTEIDIYNGWMSEVPHLRVNHEGWETVKARLRNGEMISSF